VGSRGIADPHAARPSFTLKGVIDPTNPAVVDVHDFRQAGASKRLSRVVQLENPPHNPVIAVTDGAEITADVLLESVVEGVLVTVAAKYPLTGQCSRCLDDLEDVGEVTFSELYLWDPPEYAEEDDEVPVLVTEGFIDLSTQLRDAIGLELPLAPLCAEECPGLCPQCGMRLADAGEHVHDDADPRWAALRNWQSDTDSE
jgi:uncharacterized protein